MYTFLICLVTCNSLYIRLIKTSHIVTVATGKAYKDCPFDLAAKVIAETICR